MHVTSKVSAAAAGGLCILGVWLVMLNRSGLPATEPPELRSVRPVPARSPSAEALWQARAYRTRAVEAANQERYKVLEAAPPEATWDHDTERWRREVMARDVTGELRRAREAVRQAIRLARSPTEEYRARTWAVLIECDAGDHRKELQHARRLVHLQPRNEISLTSLRRAAWCNGLVPQAHQASEQLVELKGKRAGSADAADFASGRHSKPEDTMRGEAPKLDSPQ